MIAAVRNSGLVRALIAGRVRETEQGRKTVLPDQEEIRKIMDVTGLEPREAEAYIYLWRAEGIFEEVYSDSTGTGGGASFVSTQVSPHFHALRNMLGHKVLVRHYPVGWAMQFEEEGLEEDTRDSEYNLRVLDVEIEKVRKIVNGEMQPDEDAEIHNLLGHYDSPEDALENLRGQRENLRDSM